MRSATFGHPSIWEAYQMGVNLLPRLASFDLSIAARHDVLIRARGFTCDACAFAIRHTRLDKAVEFISAGKAIFWSQARLLRTPFDDLESVEPDLAGKLRSI